MGCILLYSGIVLNLLKRKVFSEPGSSSYVKEQSTYIFFSDILEEVECMYNFVYLYLY